MKRNNSLKILIIVGLIVGITGISLGFAAFSTTLNIKPNADITPDKSTFNVVFSSIEDEVSIDLIEPNLSSNEIIATSAVISNDIDTSTISNLSATFNEKGQSLTYTFYAYNIGKYVAYLNNVEFKNIDGETSGKICSKTVGLDKSISTDICNDIELSINVGNDTFTSEERNINGHSLNIGESDTIVVTITYKGNYTVDDDFSVKFGDIALTYSSVD